MSYKGNVNDFISKCIKNYRYLIRNEKKLKNGSFFHKSIYKQIVDKDNLYQFFKCIPKSYDETALEEIIDHIEEESFRDETIQLLIENDICIQKLMTFSLEEKWRNLLGIDRVYIYRFTVTEIIHHMLKKLKESLNTNIFLRDLKIMTPDGLKEEVNILSAVSATENIFSVSLEKLSSLFKSEITEIDLKELI